MKILDKRNYIDRRKNRLKLKFSKKMKLLI